MVSRCILFSFTLINGLSLHPCAATPNISCPQSHKPGNVDSPNSLCEGVTKIDDISEIPASGDNCINPSTSFLGIDWCLPWLGACVFIWLIHFFAKRKHIADAPKSSLACSLSSNTLKNAAAVLMLALAAAQSGYLHFDLVNAMPAFSEWYMTVLEESPVITKSMTTAWMQFTGDYFAQVVEYRIRSKTPGVLGLFRTLPDYDLRRGLSLFADGMFLSGPLLHYAFEFMETVFPTSEGHASIAALLHVFLNDYLIDTLYLAVSFVFVAIAEGHAKDLVKLLKTDFVPTVKAGWSTSIALTPVEFICFRYLSVNFRVLFMNFVDIFWGAIVSFIAHRSRRKTNATVEN